MKRNEYENLLNEIRKTNLRQQDQQRQIDELRERTFDWCNDHDVARLLKINKRTVEEYRKAEIIPFRKLGGRYYTRKSWLHDQLLQNIITKNKSHDRT
jgi:hypothetical protein